MSLYHVKLKVFTGVYQVEKIFIHNLYMYLEPIISKKIKKIKYVYQLGKSKIDNIII